MISKARLQLQLVLLALDGARPSGTLEWVSAVAPVVTQAAVGAGHWAAGAGSGPWPRGPALPAPGWWRGALAPKRRPGPRWKRTPSSTGTRCASSAHASPGGAGCAGTQTPCPPAIAERPGRPCLCLVIGVVFGVRSGLRHPRRLTAHAIASETFSAVSYVLRAARAVQRRRPRIAAGSALSAAGSLARLRAVSAEPLQ